MTGADKKRAITIAQIVLAVLAVVGIVWIAYKFIAYNHAQQAYRDIETAYAASDASADRDVAPVDVSALASAYPDFAGWIVVDGVPISYPVMHGTDNDFYLYHDPSGASNIDGSIFLDFRNNSFDDDLHAIVYGHNMIDDSMFGALKSYVSKDFYDQNAGVIHIYTPDETYRYQIFAVSIVDAADPAFAVGFQTAEVFGGFVEDLKQRSMYDTGVQVSGSDHVLTLSTCTISDRLIASAKRL